MMWEMHDGMGWWMVFGALWMVLFWSILIGGIAWLISRFTVAEPGSAALEVAKERYARGEISREQFQRISEDLRRLG
jgi:putative membrane protein